MKIHFAAGHSKVGNLRPMPARTYLTSFERDRRDSQLRCPGLNKAIIKPSYLARSQTFVVLSLGTIVGTWVPEPTTIVKSHAFGGFAHDVT